MGTFLNFVLCLCLAYLPFARGQCGWSFQQVDISDTDVSVEIYNYSSSTNLEFSSWKVSLAEGGLDVGTALAYFEQSIDDQKLFHLKTTKSFGNINNDAYTDGKNELSISLIVTLKCDGKSSDSTLLVVIKNTNQNAPQFPKSSYAYTLPMPIMPKTDFSLFGDEITATDIDFSTNKITFSIDPEEFSVTSSKVSDENKSFQAVFRANEIIRLTESKTYTLTATDSGTPPKSTSVEVTLNVDAAAGIDSPSFSSGYYSYNYTVGATPTLVPTSGDIIVSSDKSNECTYALSGDNSELFALDFTNTSKTFNIAIKTGSSLPEDVSSPVVLTLRYTTDVTIYAVILITVVNDEKIPTFTNDYYIGTYNIDTNKITWSEPIKVTDAITVEADGDKASLFNVDTTTYEITPKNPLSKTDFDENSNIILVLKASSKTRESRAAVVISLESSTEFKFDNVYYTGAYSVSNKKGVVSLDSDIGFSDLKDFTGITIAVDKSYSSNFKIELDSSDSTKWKFTVLKELDGTVLNSNTELTIPITATRTADSIQSTAILVLKLPEVMKFTDPYYTANYIKGSDGATDTVTLEKEITVEGVDASDVTIALGAYGSNFKVEPDSSKWKVTVIKNLDTTELNSNTKLTIPITATKTADSTKTTAVLILTLPTTIKFSDPYYTADYIKGSDSEFDTITLGKEINIEGADATDITFTLDKYSSNFKVELDSSDSSKWKITVVKDLDTTVLNLNTKLTISITATKTSDSTQSTAILILSLPGIIRFSDSYYNANYVRGSGTDLDTITLVNDISIDGADTSEIAITLDAYGSNFKVEPDSSKWKVTVIKNLDTTELNSNTKLTIPITATKTSDSTKTTAVLILTLPATIKFSDPYYTADYVKGSGSELDTITLGKEINIEGADATDITFTLDTYSSNLRIELDSSKWKVTVLKNLDSETLNANTELSIVITATKKGDSSESTAVLILKLPDKSEIKFDQSYYTANYVEGSGTDLATVVLDKAISIVTADASDVSVNFDGYDDNFVANCDSSSLKCTITVKKNLNISILATPELLMTLTASHKNGITNGKAVLLLKLPSTSSTFSFKNPYYAATYTIQKSDTEKATVVLNDTISFNGAELSELTIVADDYSDQFSFKFDSEWNLIVKENLDSDILSTHSELIISLTAQKTAAKSDYSKATLVIKLPDKITMAFLKPQYSGEYVIDKSGTASVVLTDESEIKSTDNDIQITLDSYIENFGITFDKNSKWTINVLKPLDTSVLTKNKQLKLIMTITKVGVKYGEAALIISLPDPSFTRGFYIADYIDDASTSIKLQDYIEMINVNADEIQVNLSKYNDYIYTVLEDSKWNLELSHSLPTDITEHYEILLITLEAIRISDNTQLATSTLVVKLPDINSTDIPKFTQFAFYGEYKNSSEKSSVTLTSFINLTNSEEVKISKVYIDDTSSKYSTNFELNSRTDGTYDISVKENLSPDILNTETSIVLTLVANTTTGNKGYAALAISLPKTTRESSVQFKNEEILYTGTYENGTFQSPSITLETNTTDSSKIEVEITNDLDVDNKYFKPKYSNKVLTVQVDDLPKDVLKKYTVIPLKLAITDKDSGDTVHAVLNVNINYKHDDDDDGGDSSSGVRTSLLVAVIILACLLVGVIAAVFFLWYFKFRNARYVTMDEEEEVEKPVTNPHGYTKNLTRQTSVPTSSSSLRRPTGLPIGLVPPESPTEETSSDFEISPSAPPHSLENEKKVIFDDHVQNIDETETTSDEPSGSFQNIADRRPTKFVFGYPLEEGVLDSPTERRESSDYIGIDPDKKKSVVFDENVERMHIDVVDDENNESDNDSDKEEETESDSAANDDKLKNFKSELEIKVAEQLPSDIYKQIF